MVLRQATDMPLLQCRTPRWTYLHHQAWRHGSSGSYWGSTTFCWSCYSGFSLTSHFLIPNQSTTSSCQCWYCLHTHHPHISQKSTSPWSFSSSHHQPQPLQSISTSESPFSIAFGRPQLFWTLAIILAMLSPTTPSCFTINFSLMVYSHLSPYCTSTINLGPQLGIWPMSLGFESSIEGAWLDLSVIVFIFLLYSLPHFPSFTWFQIYFTLLIFSPLSFSAARRWGHLHMEGGRWNRGSVLQSMVTCTVDTHITCTSYSLLYHHLTWPAICWEASLPVPPALVLVFSFWAKRPDFQALSKLNKILVSLQPINLKGVSSLVLVQPIVCTRVRSGRQIFFQPPANLAVVTKRQ